MVPQRRVDYGFNGYQMPEVPRASRSARGKGPIKKKLEGNQIHAFEILASVAGELLESENPLPSNASSGNDPHYAFDDTLRKQPNEGNSLKEEPCEWGSCDEEASLHACGVQGSQQNHTLNQLLHPQENFSFEMSATSKSNDQSGKVRLAKKLGTVDSSSSCGSYSNKVISDCPLPGDLIEEEEKEYAVRKRKLEAEPSKDTSRKDGEARVFVCSEDLIEMDEKPSDLVSSEHDLKEPFPGDCKIHGSLLCHCVEVVSRDDDENAVGYVQPCTLVEEFEHKPNVGDRKVKNMSASKHWRIAPDTKIGGYHRTDGKIKQLYRNGRPCYAHQRSQKIYPFKKRKFFNQKPFTTTDRGCNCENIFSSPDNREDGGNCNAANGRSCSTIGREPLKSSDRNVRLSIKSFKVPELFFEIPATATVGSLKRTVMEAVTSILEDGLHVGILVQGKKVRDDNKTLLQTGISHGDKLDNLGFTLEPKHTKLSYSQCGDDPSSVSGRGQELTRHSASVSRPGTSNVSLNPTVINLGSSVDKDLKAVPSLASTSVVKTPPASQALVAVPPINAKPLAVVPFHRRSGHPAYVQRRMRRPFSVSEVEALVQAVEKLGTGRWRDVKMRAFDNAKHRTYVDLKDKWKTLVHTARISAQQRRGEPVPQELLDRVLAAHAYWSQRQAKQQLRVAA